MTHHIRSIRAPNPGPFTLEGTESWLIDDEAIVDPGPDIASHIEALLSAMPRLSLILITHRHADHAPAARALRERTGARVFAPDGVLDDRLVDARLVGGESIALCGGSLEVIATPGHTAEHVCFLSDNGDLFSGDMILGSGTTAVFPPDGRMSDYIRSLRLLRERSPRRIFPAHGPRRDDALALIDAYLAHREERERQVLDAWSAGCRTLGAMRARIYPDLDERLHGGAEAQLSAHVIKLVEEGRIGGAG